MKIAIIFASHEGQTGKIARFIEDDFRQKGHKVETFDVDASGSISIDDADAVILAAPVHQARHPDSFEATILAFSERLKALPTLMLSVSLNAAFPEGHAEAQEYLDEMKARTGLMPTHEALVAGAVKLGQYDYFAAQVVKFIVLRGRDFDPALGEHEFTDWKELGGTLKTFAIQIESPS